MVPLVIMVLVLEGEELLVQLEHLFLVEHIQLLLVVEVQEENQLLQTNIIYLVVIPHLIV